MAMKFLLFICIFGIFGRNGSDAKYELADERVHFDGELIPKEHPKHPHNLCREALNNQRAYWMMPKSRVETCNNYIQCALYGEVLKTLKEKPDEGVYCNYPGKIWGKEFLACVQGECILMGYKH